MDSRARKFWVSAVGVAFILGLTGGWMLSRIIMKSAHSDPSFQDSLPAANRSVELEIHRFFNGDWIVEKKSRAIVDLSSLGIGTNEVIQALCHEFHLSCPAFFILRRPGCVTLIPRGESSEPIFSLGSLADELSFSRSLTETLRRWFAASGIEGALEVRPHRSERIWPHRAPISCPLSVDAP